MKTETKETGGNFLGVLAILFIGLKLADIIDWSWWWVLSPIWLPLTIAALFVFLVKKAESKIQNKEYRHNGKKSKFQTRLEEVAKQRKENK
tara:strand:- start:4568 stop:4840 length:273 start_codon:yes stop_codon:yes gene_type:complete